MSDRIIIDSNGNLRKEGFHKPIIGVIYFDKHHPLLNGKMFFIVNEN